MCGEVDKYAFKIENMSNLNLKYQHLKQDRLCVRVVYSQWIFISRKTVSNGGV